MPGYGDPPKEHQFSSENQPEKKGRPRGAKGVGATLKRLLASQDKDGDYTVPLAKKLLQLGFNKDDLNAIKEMLDRTEGKVPNRNFVSGDPENPHGVTINVNPPDVDDSAEKDS